MPPSHEEKVKSLRLKREGFKIEVNDFKDLLEDPTTSTIEIKQRLADLELEYTAFAKSQPELDGVDETGALLKDRLQLKSLYLKVRARGYSLCEEREQARAAANLPNLTSQSPVSPYLNSGQSPLSHLHETEITLPALNLPTFSGDYEEWPAFASHFKSTVHDCPRLDDCKRLIYLRSCLKNDAAATIESLPNISANYALAWQALEERFNRPAVIVSRHLKTLFDLPPLTKTTHSDLRSFLIKFQSHCRSLIGFEQLSVDTLLIFLAVSKLDSATVQRWREHTRREPFPGIDVFYQFLHDRIQVLEPASLSTSINQPASSPKGAGQNISKQAPRETGVKRDSRQASTTRPVFSTQVIQCAFCREGHYSSACETFIKSSLAEKNKMVKDNNLCYNCLRKGHSVKDCRSSRCRTCTQRHHTLLHTDSPRTVQINSTIVACNPNYEVILATAEIQIMDKLGRERKCRVLLDTCGHTHLMSTRLCNALQLDRHKVSIPLKGTNDMTSVAQYTTKARFRSCHTTYENTIPFLVVDEVSQSLPLDYLDRSALDIPSDIALADPRFDEPHAIDGLLGAQITWQLLREGKIQLAQPNAELRYTELGWIVVGEVRIHNGSRPKGYHIHLASLQSEIAQFWEIEEGPTIKRYSPEEEMCEQYYTITTQRDVETGRYTVRLPFRDSKRDLGTSHSVALNRFLALERRLGKNPDHKSQYVEFLREYERLGHMTAVQDDPSTGYYLPHHAVVKLDSLTTKLRVVFDGSTRTSTNISLNNALMVGPTLHNDLFDIILRFRLHPFVLSADIEKMFRQIIVHPQDRCYQKILWRESSAEPIKTFELNTVTYGTGPAPYLATRTLHQLATDHAATHSRAAKIIKEDCYVDDVLTGTDTLETAIELREELISLTRLGGFHLRQWTSNNMHVVEGVTSTAEKDYASLNLVDDKKTLGLRWKPSDDVIIYSVRHHEIPRQFTKRIILSRIAQLFDPLGLIGPVIVSAKIFMQDLWKASITWDETVPTNLETAWREYEEQLPLLQHLAIPRCVVTQGAIELQLHGFCDASERAYGACLYVRSTSANGHHMVQLLCSKSRVAPLKTQSIPRLELCSAVLLIKLYQLATQNLSSKFKIVKFWSDSQTTLKWIQTSPHRLKTFVANRVTEIQGNSNHEQWRYVPSAQNPADLLSRGLKPEDILNKPMWHKGPSYLENSEEHWPKHTLEQTQLLEEKAVTVMITSPKSTNSLINRYSSFQRLQRIIAYCLRFIMKLRKQPGPSGPLSVIEVEAAHTRIIKITQEDEFHTDRQQIANGRYTGKGRLGTLTPFLDSHGLLRVGGRLHNANIQYDIRHPLILPRKGHLTDIIMRYVHQQHGHAGVQGTLSAVRQRYWPIGGRTAVKRIVKGCVTCRRANPKPLEYIMGNLPKDRITLVRPFLVTGIDYCGPFYIKERRYRNVKTVKTYVAVFVCFSVKAVHLELVSDLTSEAFLAALRRFIARRGKPTDIYSDNGTNFVGAHNQVLAVQDLLKSEAHNELVRADLLSQGIQWHFSPPRTPHFGGLWEAAVRSFKHHFYRVVGTQVLTFEALNTCLVEIEAILNSRPLLPLSEDPNDLSALTPGHFLIGNALTSLPEQDITAYNTSRLTMWDHTRQIRQHFWSRWQKDYLNQMITRHKWHQSDQPSIKEGMLVIIKEDYLPPLSWPLGRVSAVHPGDDGTIRVVTLRTATGELKRCVRRLALLID